MHKDLNEGIKIKPVQRQIFLPPPEGFKTFCFSLSLYFLLRGILILIKKSDDVAGLYSGNSIEVLFNIFGLISAVVNTFFTKPEMKTQTQKYVIILNLALFGYLSFHIFKIYQFFQYDVCDSVHPDYKGYCPKYLRLIKILLLYDLNGLVISGIVLFQSLKIFGIITYQSSVKTNKREDEDISQTQNSSFINP